jgi:hypothetical protein
VLERDAAGTARVLVALEVGAGALTFSGVGAARAAQLDVTVLGASRDGAPLEPVGTHVTLGAEAEAEGGFYLLAREVRLPPGPALVRAVVRDTASGHSGLVTERLVVPSAGRPYISTPLLSDRELPPGSAGPRPVAAHRTFAARGQLFCTYEVFAPGGTQPALHVAGAFRVEDASGQEVASAPPTPIAATADGRVVRMVALSLEGLAPGRYRLVVEAEDAASGLHLETGEDFFIGG